MPPSDNQPYVWSYQHLRMFLRIIDDWEPQDKEVILEGKADNFSVDRFYRQTDSAVVDPFEWVRAIEQEQQERRDYYARLITNHNYPDTSNMSPERAQITNLSFLMAKYPDSDWDVLLTDSVRVSNESSRMPKPAQPPVIIPKQVPKELPRDLPEERLKPVEQVASANVTEITVIGNESSEPVSDDVNQEKPSPNMDVKEVAKIIGMTEQTTRRFMTEGALPYAKKLRRNWVVPREPFMEWFKGNDDTVRTLSEPKPRPKRTPKEPEPARVHRHGRSASF